MTDNRYPDVSDEEQDRIERISLGNKHLRRKGWTCAKCKTLVPCRTQRLLKALDAAKRERDALRAALEWVQLHDHSHDAQLARVVAGGLRGEGTA